MRVVETIDTANVHTSVYRSDELQPAPPSGYRPGELHEALRAQPAFRLRSPRVGWLWAAVYVCGMAAAALSGSAFVIGGLVAGASGWGAISLAAAVPLAGLLWVLTLTLLQRLHRYYQ
jgi:hypothetical protein